MSKQQTFNLETSRNQAAYWVKELINKGYLKPTDKLLNHKPSRPCPFLLISGVSGNDSSSFCLYCPLEDIIEGCLLDE